MPFETVTRQRVGEKKQPERKDSLDDISAGSSDSDYAPPPKKPVPRKEHKEPEAKKPAEKVQKKQKVEVVKQEPVQEVKKVVEEKPQQSLKKAKKQEEVKQPQKQKQKPAEEKKAEAPPPQKKQEPAPKETAKKADKKQTPASQEVAPQVKKAAPEPKQQPKQTKQAPPAQTQGKEQKKEDSYDSESSSHRQSSDSDDEKFAKQFTKVRGNQLSKQGKQKTSEVALLKQKVEQTDFSTKPNRKQSDDDLPTGKAADAEEVRVLAPKKTIAAKDGMGDWEVVDKRDTMRVKKRNLYDSDDGSELSSDSY